MTRKVRSGIAGACAGAALPLATWFLVWSLDEGGWAEGTHELLFGIAFVLHWAISLPAVVVAGRGAFTLAALCTFWSLVGGGLGFLIESLRQSQHHVQ